MTGQARPERLPRRLRVTRGLRYRNNVIAVLIDLGVVAHSYVMTTRGRRTGRLRRTPVTLVEHDDGRRWLVAPHGPVSWVHNARAAGMVSLRRGSRVTAYRVREVDPGAAGAILQEYQRVSPGARSYFHAGSKAPVEEYAAEAHLHPVFELLPR